MPEIVYICLDVEASGPIPDPYNLVSIGAVPVVQSPEGDGRWPAGDLFIVYPGPEGPYLTPRWEILRDGFEDHELLSMLRDATIAARGDGRDAEAGAAETALAQALTDVAGPAGELTSFTEDPTELEAARIRVFEALDALLGS